MKPQTFELDFQSTDGQQLSGELVIPEQGASQLALLHQGSTLCDRDGNVPRIHMRSTLYRRFAILLAERGVASFRYGKRQWDRPKPEPLDYSLTHRVMDLCAAYRMIVKHEAVRDMAVHIVGHSEGGVVAQLAACELGESDTTPRSVAILASPAVTLLDSMLWRAYTTVTRNSAKNREASEAVIAANWEWRRRVDVGHDFELEEFERFLDYYTPKGGTQGWESWPWVKEHAQLKIREYTVKLPCTGLFLHGDHDRLVDVKNLERYRIAAEGALRTDLKFEIIEGLGHYLEDSTRKAFVVSTDLAERVANWIKEGR